MPLAVRGLRDAADLDVIVTEALWQRLAARYAVRHVGFAVITIGPVQALGPGSHFTVLSIAPVGHQIATADVIDGRRYVALSLLRRFKRTLGRDKDRRDMGLIDHALR